MLEHKPAELLEALKEIAEVNAVYRSQVYQSRGDSRLTSEQLNQLLHVIHRITTCLQSLDMNDILSHAARRCSYLEHVGSVTVAVAAGELDSMIGLVSDRLSGRRFAYIPAERAGYFEQEMPFGPDVWDAFPSMRQFIRDACNCMSIEINNAAIHEFIRVSEHGLRLLAVYCMVPERDDDVRNLDWGRMIDGIRAELRRQAPEINGKRKRTPQERNFAVEFCIQAVQIIEDIYRGYRNENAHNRADYTIHESRHVCDLTERFMRKLSKRLSDELSETIPGFGA